MNLEIEQLRRAIVGLVNNSGLPIGVAYYVLKDSLADLKTAYDNTVQYEMNQQREAQEKQDKEAQERQDKGDTATTPAEEGDGES